MREQAAMRAFRRPFASVHEFAFYGLVAVIALQLIAVVLTEVHEGGRSRRRCLRVAKFSHAGHQTRLSLVLIIAAASTAEACCSTFVACQAMRYFGAHFFDCAFGHILCELADYNWSSVSDNGDCAGIKIRASVLRVAGYMSNHRLAIVSEHYSREAAMRDAPTHASPIVAAVKIGHGARPTSSGKCKRIRKTQLWFSC